MNSFLSDLFWIVLVLVGFAFSIMAIRFIWRLAVSLMYFGGEAADAVYKTGDSDTHTLLKVIITILFPPLLVFWMWKFLADGYREDAPTRAERKEQQLREHQENMASEKAAREKRAEGWNK